MTDEVLFKPGHRRNVCRQSTPLVDSCAAVCAVGLWNMFRPRGLRSIVQGLTRNPTASPHSGFGDIGPYRTNAPEVIVISGTAAIADVICANPRP
jgi:hypothetical protein